MSDQKAVQRGVIDQARDAKTPNQKEHQKAAEELLKESQGKATMTVRIYSPYRTYFEGPAFSVSAENKTGPFDILPHHHNFVSLLTPCEMVVRTTTGAEQAIRISGGLMHVKADELIVFLDV